MYHSDSREIDSDDDDFFDELFTKDHSPVYHSVMTVPQIMYVSLAVGVVVLLVLTCCCRRRRQRGAVLAGPPAAGHAPDDTPYPRQQYAPPTVVTYPPVPPAPNVPPPGSYPAPYVPGGVVSYGGGVVPYGGGVVPYGGGGVPYGGGSVPVFPAAPSAPDHSALPPTYEQAVAGEPYAKHPPYNPGTAH